MKDGRRGFSLVELLIVVVMIGVLTLVAVPKVRIYRDRSNVNAARERIESMIAIARASAIHKSQYGVFHSSGNWLSVWTWDQPTNSYQQQVSWHNLDTLYPGVAVQLGGAGWSSLWYEPRGVTWSTLRPPSTVVFRIVGRTRTDSVCVSRHGQILPRGCTL
jgi:prepilin-type N-terminal cleavage/methylation domain-containing protein